jgi:hypothetical protein
MALTGNGPSRNKLQFGRWIATSSISLTVR